MSTRLNQPNFTGGIIGSDLYSRSDTTKFTTGVKDAVNLLIRPQGGLQNRSGFRLASGFDTGDGVSTQWLIPFALTGQSGLHLEFGDGKFAVIRNGAYVLDSAHTPLGIDRITYDNPAVIEIDGVSAGGLANGDLVFLSDPNGDHVLGNQILRVINVTASSPPDLVEIEFEIFDWTEPDTSSGAGVWGTLGAGATLQKIYTQTHPFDLEDVPFLRYAQDRLDLYIAHRDYDPQKITFNDLDDWTVAPVTFAPGIAAPDTGTPFAKPITGATQANPCVITSTGHDLTDGSVVYIASVGGMTQLNGNYYVIRDVTANTFSLENLDGSAVNSTGFTAYTSGGTASCFHIRTLAAGAITYRYLVTALAADSLEESLPTATVLTIASANLASGNVVLNWPAVPGASLYNVYRETRSGFGYIGTTASAIFTDVNIEPDVTLTPPTTRNPFADADNKPGLVSFFEQRLTFASTRIDPAVIEMSKTNSFGNFTISYPSKPDDALRFRLRTKELNDVRAIVSGRALFLMTTSAEWVVTGNDNEGVLTPTSIVPRPESYWGGYDIEPVVVGDRVLFVQPSGETIRDFLLTLNPNSEQSRDLTILVRDLFEGREITSWCYTQAPDRLVWVTLSDGTLLSLCYMDEHDIWGWTRHVVGGDDVTVYQVSSVREGARDVLYAVIGRQTDFGEVIMTERLDPRVDRDVTEAYFVDSGLTYDAPGEPASILSGLLHLRGQTVVGLVDGNVVEDLLVDEAGKVDLGAVSGELIHLGLQYVSYMETLPVDFETEGLGSMRGRFKAVTEVALSLKRSRGVAAGISIDNTEELVEWTPDMVDGPIPLFTKTVNINVDGDWLRDASVVVAQFYPLPMTLLGIAPIWELGE